MTESIFVLFGLAALAAAYSIYRALPMFRFRGSMLVTCPENLKPAAIKVAMWRAAAGALVGRRHLEVGDCSRWRQRRSCGQYCLFEIAEDPGSHRVWSVASRWYQGKKCVYCKKPIPPLTGIDRHALLGAEGKTLEWDSFPPEKLPEALSASLPVCCNCHIIETFIRLHPDRVYFRPWERNGPLGEYTPKNLN